MTRLTIRKSGGTNIVSIPRAVLKSIGLHTGSEVDLCLEDNKIVLIPLAESVSLDELLAGSPRERLALDADDQAWLDEKPIGREE